jgi:predicted metalloprotease
MTSTYRNRALAIATAALMLLALLAAVPTASAHPATTGTVGARLDARRGSPVAPLAHNRLFKAKALPTKTCARAQVPLNTKAGLKAYYGHLKSCLDAAWKKRVKQAGFHWRSPHVVIWSKAIKTTCGRGTLYVSFYCPTNRTIYMSLDELQSWSANPQYDGLGGRLGYLRGAFVFSHEFGHHIQTLMGVWRTAATLVRQHKTTWKKITPGTELQASCFSLVFLRSVRNTYPIQSDVMADWRWRLVHLASHGSDAHQKHWMNRGFKTGKPGSCNVFAARPDQRT